MTIAVDRRRELWVASIIRYEPEGFTCAGGGEGWDRLDLYFSRNFQNIVRMFWSRLSVMSIRRFPITHWYNIPLQTEFRYRNNG